LPTHFFTLKTNRLNRISSPIDKASSQFNPHKKPAPQKKKTPGPRAKGGRQSLTKRPYRLSNMVFALSCSNPILCSPQNRRWRRASTQRQS